MATTKLTKVQRKTLKHIQRACEEYDACVTGPRVSRSVAEALVRKGMIVKGGWVVVEGVSDRPRAGYMMLEAGYNALGFEIVDVLP